MIELEFWQWLILAIVVVTIAYILGRLIKPGRVSDWLWKNIFKDSLYTKVSDKLMKKLERKKRKTRDNNS